MWMDPEAAAGVRGVVGGGEPKLPRCVGLDVTEQAVMPREDVDAVCAPAPDSPLGADRRRGQLLHRLLRVDAAGRVCMHDPLALAVAIDRSLGA